MTACTCGVGNVWGDQQAERAHSPSCPFRQEMLARGTGAAPKDPWGRCYLDCHNYPQCPCGRIDFLECRYEAYEQALEMIAAGPRPDGTYNLSREACEQIAKGALST